MQSKSSKNHEERKNYISCIKGIRIRIKHGTSMPKETTCYNFNDAISKITASIQNGNLFKNKLMDINR